MRWSTSRCGRGRRSSRPSVVLGSDIFEGLSAEGLAEYEGKTLERLLAEGELMGRRVEPLSASWRSNSIARTSVKIYMHAGC